MTKIPSITQLINELSKLPGVGTRTAERLTYFLLKHGPKNIPQLSKALQNVLTKIKHCKECFNFTEEDLCTICSQANRDITTLCIVESPSSLHNLESGGTYRGAYHILHGALSPLDGVAEEHLKIKELYERIEKSFLTDKPIKEVIFALDPDLEGDTTRLYIGNQLAKYSELTITSLAHGVPVGGDINYLSYRTLAKALENRQRI